MRKLFSQNHLFAKMKIKMIELPHRFSRKQSLGWTNTISNFILLFSSRIVACRVVLRSTPHPVYHGTKSKVAIIVTSQLPLNCKYIPNRYRNHQSIFRPFPRPWSSRWTVHHASTCTLQYRSVARCERAPATSNRPRRNGFSGRKAYKK